MRILVTIIILLAIFSCKSTKPITAGPSAEANVVLSMQKTACYGTCPVYQLQIYSDLTVTLKGEQHIDQIGTYSSTIGKDQFDELVGSFKEADFFSFEKEYWEGVSDLPTTYVYFSDKGKEMKVMDYYGAPKELKELEALLAKLVDDLTWTKVSD